jgi:heptosyltransferase-2
MRINKENIKNILAVRNDRFGEFLLNIPALRALKETFVNARLIVIIAPYVRELAQSLLFIDEIIEWNRAKPTFLAKLRLMKLLKRKNIDLAIMLNPSKDLNIITWLAGIPIRVGYDRKLGFLLTHKIKDKKYLGEKHEIEYNLELVSLVGAKTEDRRLSIAIDDNTIVDLLRNNRIKDFANLIAVHPWTSDPIKQWPLEYFSTLVQRLIKDLNLTVLIMGGKEELNKKIYLPKQLENNLINLTGKTTLKQLAAILKKCKMLISGDSGPVHLACAVNTQVLAIFRSDILGKGSRRWGPWGTKHMVIEKDNLSDISPDEVFNKVKEMLGVHSP